MTITTSNLHPADQPLFLRVASAMRAVAKRYELPLQSIAPHPDGDYRTSPLGDCSSTGYIRLVMRGRLADGTWDADARREEDVWGTAAHELAHLRHMNHGVAFHDFEMEMRTALSNQQRDHREKVIERLVKMQAQRDSEHKLGNIEAAETFAAAINKMLIEHELNPTDLDYARTADDDPVVEIKVDFKLYKIDEKKSRIAWQESLARLVAKAHLCKFLIRTGSNQIWFVGTRSHATVAEYVYGTLVPVVATMAQRDCWRARAEAYRQHGERVEGRCIQLTREVSEQLRGFQAAWLEAFLTRISERFDEARRQAVETATADGVTTSSTALVRLNGALVKAQAYIDNRFQTKRRYANPLAQVTGSNSLGKQMGRAAADKLNIGRRGIETSGPVKRLRA